MDVNWYSGRYAINDLTLWTCDLRIIIKANVFDMAQFSRTLNRLTIHHMVIQYELGMLKGLHRLLKLSIFRTKLVDIDDYLLQPVCRSLHIFFYYGRVTNFTLNTIFGKVKLLNLTDVRILGKDLKRQARIVLGPQNFSSLVAIESLSLNQCGIESILEKTFDLISETLIWFSLSSNMIKKVAVALFVTFLDRKVSDMNYAYTRTKGLQMGNNIIECDCDIYELTHLLFVSFQYMPKKAFYDVLLCGPSVSNETQLLNHYKCPNIQEIHNNRLCRTNPQLPSYSYTRFEMTFNNKTETILIKTAASQRYRLWMINHNSVVAKNGDRCPNATWLNSSTRCFLLKHGTHTFPASGYIHKSDFTTFCIIYLMENKSSWPVHCLTVLRDLPK